MVGVITLPPPGGIIGPGFGIEVQFTGPVVSGDQWSFEVDGTQETSGLVVSRVAQLTGTTQQLRVLDPADSQWLGFGLGTVLSSMPDEREAVNVIAKHTDSTGLTKEFLEVPASWTTTRGIGLLIHAQGRAPTSSLTPQQDQALQEVHQSTFVDHVLDTLTLDPMSPPGGGAGPFNRTLLTPTAGILVRMTGIAEGLLPNTPDGDYWLTSLAVIRLFRGADLWKRIPVHTSSKLYYWLDENVVVGATQAVFSGWLLNMSVQVTIREGCTAEVFVLHYP
jgi:hypothetical protein